MSFRVVSVSPLVKNSLTVCDGGLIMSTVKVEGNNLHGKSPDVLESEKKPERERRFYEREPWSPERERRVSMEVVSSGSMIEATGGFAAIVLSIISLTNVVPMYLVPIATIVIGVVLLFEGGAVASRYWKLPSEIAAGRWASMELAGGMIAEFFAGLAGIVLGILALLGFVPVILTTISVLAFGSALVLGSGLTSRLNHLEYGIEDEEPKRAFYRRFWLTNWAAASVQIVFGFAAIVLGILALLGIATLTLTTISLLILGFSVLLSGSAISSRIMHLMHRC